MKTKVCLLIILVFTLLGSFAQTINVNPDPNGEPWTVSTACSNTASPCIILDFIPNQASLNKVLPDSVHNEKEIWWPFIINQGGYNSCVQVAEIFYTFTYEINRKRNLDAGSILEEFPDRNYDQHYGYNQNVTGVNTYSPWHS